MLGDAARASVGIVPTSQALGLSELLSLLTRTGFDHTIERMSRTAAWGVTFFAPVSPTLLADLSARTSTPLTDESLRDILRAHVSTGVLTAATLAGMGLVQTDSGQCHVVRTESLPLRDDAGEGHGDGDDNDDDALMSLDARGGDDESGLNCGGAGGAGAGCGAGGGGVGSGAGGADGGGGGGGGSFGSAFDIHQQIAARARAAGGNVASGLSVAGVRVIASDIPICNGLGVVHLVESALPTLRLTQPPRREQVRVMRVGVRAWKCVRHCACECAWFCGLRV
jgi:hypothetical protein